MSVEVEGLEEVQRFLARLPSLLREAGDEICEATAEKTKPEAKRVVPVRTGNLRDHIEVVKEAAGVYHAGSEVEYAGYVERGTSKMRAQPYMRPAAEVAVNTLTPTAQRILEEKLKLR